MVRRRSRGSSPFTFGCFRRPIAPLIGLHLYLLRRHGVFGSEFEYTERLAKLHETQRLEEYSRYELDDDDDYRDGSNGYEGNGHGDNGRYRDRE